LTSQEQEAVRFRQSPLRHPSESQDVYFKSSATWDITTDFTLKLIKHVMGMANNGGGWLVIGFKENADGVLEPDPAHLESICAGYDPTPIAQQVNTMVARGQRVELDTYREPHPDTGVRYPMIHVQPFRTTPIVCRTTRPEGDNAILKKGRVYLRRSGAATSEVSTPEDWEAIVTRAVELQRHEWLRQMGDALSRLGASEPEQPSVSESAKTFMERMRKRALAPSDTTTT
jgi:hypothetical protein